MNYNGMPMWFQNKVVTKQNNKETKLNTIILVITLGK